MFIRKAFYGLNFDWYGVDDNGELAIFTAGYAPIPNHVFLNEDKYNSVNYYISNLPIITKSHLTDDCLDLQRNGLANYSIVLKASQKGLFCFEEAAMPRPDKYLLQAFPDVSLKITDLPVEVREFVGDFHFKGIVFRDYGEIDVCSFFSVDQNQTNFGTYAV